MPEAWGMGRQEQAELEFFKVYSREREPDESVQWISSSRLRETNIFMTRATLETASGKTPIEATDTYL